MGSTLFKTNSVSTDKENQVKVLRHSVFIEFLNDSGKTGNVC